MSELEYRGVQISGGTEGLKLQLTQGFSIGGGAGISVRGKDQIVPSRRGRVPLPRVADVRSLLIEGWVIGNTPDDWRDSTDIFNTIFDPELDAGILSVTGPYLGVLVAVTYTINARTLNTMAGPILSGARAQHWSVELESVDPDWTSGGGSGS